MKMEKKNQLTMRSSKVAMESIKNRNWRTVKDDSMSGQILEGLDCQGMVKNLRWHERNRSSNEAHDAHIA